MAFIDRFTNGVVIGSVTTAVVIIMVIFIVTERRVIIQHKLLRPLATEPAPALPFEDVAPSQPWSLIDRQAYLSHSILAPELEGSLHRTRRLARNLVPTRYELEMQPQLEGKPSQVDTFRGRVTIHFNVTFDTQMITLHASSDLEVSLRNRKGLSFTVHRAEPPFQKIKTHYLLMRPEDEFLHVRLGEKLRANNSYIMTISFRGKLGTDRGFYKYHYRVNGTLRHLLLTFFEPTYARRAFPCFDEPGYKAVFSVTIVRPQGYTALSTMPVKKEEERPNGLVAVTFHDTMPMSTYTLAFAILNFTAQTKGNVTIWSLEERAPYLQYALDVAPRLVKFYEDLLGTPYPLPKIDMISLPSFLADAMENWGLLTFHEQCLLYNPRTTPFKKPLIVGLIAHEIAHQWFGNLVTMDWWSNLWLNEGFATYMQYSGADFIEQHWRMMDLLVVNEMQPILKAEATAPMHPLSIVTNSTHHLDAMFDRIVYSKGSSVIRMMVHFLTPKVFLSGIKSYLEKHRFKNAGLKDLFVALSKAQTETPKVSLLSVMNSWLKVPGYPLVTVTRNYTNGTVSLSQEPYAPTVNTEEHRKTVWHIPITHTSSSDKQLHRNATFEWLANKTGLLNRTVDSKEWLIVNVQRVGYYRVNYDPFNWRLLQSQLKENPLAIHVLNRAQLIDDAMDLAKHGFLDYDIALEFLELVRPEDDYMPWKAALDGIHDLDFLVRKTKFYRKYQVYVKFVLENRFDIFTQGERKVEIMTDNLFRKAIVMNSCYFGNNDCLAFSTSTFRRFLNDTAKVVRALRKNPWRTMVVLCQGVRIDNGSHWQFVMDHVEAATTQEGKRAVVRALGCTDNRDRLRTLARRTTAKAGLPIKLHYIFESLMETPEGEEIASEFLMKNLKKLIHRHGTGNQVANAIRAVVAGLRSSERLAEMKKYYKRSVRSRRRIPRKVDAAFAATLSDAEKGLAWVQRHGEAVEKWLDAKLAKYPYLYEELVNSIY